MSTSASPKGAVAFVQAHGVVLEKRVRFTGTCQMSSGRCVALARADDQPISKIKRPVTITAWIQTSRTMIILSCEEA